jgi:hypothetical protein
MDSNPISEGFSGRGIEATDDVEGHSIKGHLNGPDADEVEGHTVRPKGLVSEETDDVEGHGTRFAGLVEDDDDTEGHGVKIKI